LESDIKIIENNFKNLLSHIKKSQNDIQNILPVNISKIKHDLQINNDTLNIIDKD